MQDDIHRLILDIFVLMQTENHKNPKSLCLTRKLQKKSPLMCGLSEIMVIPSYENDTFFFFFLKKHEKNLLEMEVGGTGLEKMSV